MSASFLAIDRGLYKIKANKSYDFKSCQKHNREKSKSYYLRCQENKMVEEKNLNRLMYDMSSIKKNILEKKFLNDLKVDVVLKLKKNDKKLKALINCFQSNIKSQECQKEITNILYSVKKSLPRLRRRMAQMDTPGYFFSKGKPERFSRKIKHPLSDKKIKEVSKKEAVSLSNHIRQLEESFKQDIYKEGKIQGISKCLIKLKGQKRKLLIKSDTCRKYELIVQTQINKKFENQNKKYKEEYHKLLDTNPLLQLLSVSGEEKVPILLKDILSSLLKLKKEGKKSINEVVALQGEGLKKLLAYNLAVDQHINKKGPSKLRCDLAQNLKNDLDFGSMKIDISIGVASLIGGGLCTISFGIGCVLGVLGGAELLALQLSEKRFQSSKVSFYSGLVDSEETLEREFERDLAIYLAPLALVGSFKLGLKNLPQPKKKPYLFKKKEKVHSEEKKKESSKRYDSTQREEIDQIEKELAGKKSLLLGKYNPGNKFNLSHGDLIYLAGVSDQIEKDILKMNPSLSIKNLEKEVQKEIKIIIKQCKGDK